MKTFAENSRRTAKPRGKPFQPGQSGNPGGRPKKDERLRRIEDMAREHSEAALMALLDESANGKGAPRVAAAQAILDRGWGRPVERKESGEPGAFADMTDEQVEAEAKEAIELAVKNGQVKVLRPQKLK